MARPPGGGTLPGVCACELSAWPAIEDEAEGTADSIDEGASL